MTLVKADQVRAIARTWSGGVCFGGEHISDSAPPQKYQARILVRPARARLLASFAFPEGRRA
jgi:hypothetical protein